MNDKQFIEHIQAHLKPGEVVICKICGKTIDEICQPPEVINDLEHEAIIVPIKERKGADK